MKKSLAALTLASVLVLGACSNNDNKTTTGDSGTDSSEKTNVTVTAFGGTADAGVMKGEWPIFQFAKEKTGITLEGVLPDTVTDYGQELNLMLASGDIADIVQASAGDFFKYGKEGAFEPLDKLIDDYAPNIKKFLEENPDVKARATGPDGQIWYIPFVQDGVAQSGWWIRQDWLDKLGLKVPTTLDEYEQVLTAFANEDPNGNGKKDEIPYFHRDLTFYNGINELMSLWGAHHNFYLKDGKVAYGPLEDSYGVAYENMARWYSKGLIDPEIYTRKNARDVLLAENLGGSTHDFFASSGNYNEKLAGSIEGFNLVPIAPPANINGKKVEPTSRVRARELGWAMAASAKEKEAVMKYFDFWFTEEGRRAANFGIEGDTYEMVDGKAILTDKVLNADKAPIDVLRKVGAQTNFGFHQDFAYEEQWTSEVAMKGVNEYVENNYMEKQYPVLVFTEEENNKIETILPKISTFIGETNQQWMLGSKPIDHAKFVAELKSLGIDELIKINEDAYARYTKEVSN